MTSGLYFLYKKLKHMKIKNKLLAFFLFLSISCTQTRSGFPGTMTSVEADELYWIYVDKTNEMVLLLAISKMVLPGRVEIKEKVQPIIKKWIQSKKLQDNRLPIIIIDGEEFPCEGNKFYIITKSYENICIIKKEIDPSKLNEYPQEDWSTNEKIIFKKLRLFLD